MGRKTGTTTGLVLLLAAGLAGAGGTPSGEGNQTTISMKVGDGETAEDASIRRAA